MANDELDIHIEKAREVGRKELETEPTATRSWFDVERRLVFVELTTGVHVGFPVDNLQVISQATNEEIAAVELSPLGTGLWWENLDAHFTIAGLVAGIFGTKRWMSELGRKGGSVKSEVKAQSSRENGKRGGRPRKKTA